MEKTIVALFDNLEAAQTAVQQLLDNGFSRDDISVVRTNQQGDYTSGNMVEGSERDASGAAAGAGIGAMLGGLAGLLVGLGALAIPGIGPIIAAGPLATTLAAAGLGAATGGLVGALADAGIPEDDAGAYAEGVRRGGTLVTVRATEGQISHATEILNRFAPVDINQRAGEWRSVDATGSDAAAASSSTSSGAPSTLPESSNMGASAAGAGRDAAGGSTNYRASTGYTGESSGGTYEGTGSAGYTGAGTTYQGTGTFTSNTEPGATRQAAGSGTWGDAEGAMRSGHGEMSTSQGGEAQARMQNQDAIVHPRSSEGDYQARRDFLGGPETEGDFRSDVSAADSMIETGRGTFDSQGQSAKSSQEDAVEGQLGAERSQGAEQPYKGMEQGAQDVRTFSQDARDSLEQSHARTMGDMSRGFEAYDRDFRTNWEQSYRATGYGYERFQPAYQYGYNLATDAKYRSHDWGDIESDVRRDWETRHPNDAWEDFKDAVRHAWRRARSGVRNTLD